MGYVRWIVTAFQEHRFLRLLVDPWFYLVCLTSVLLGIYLANRF
jgi:hypothetical protein